MMQISKTPLLGLNILQPTIQKDHRGHFMEYYHQEKFAQMGIHFTVVQENISHSKKGTIRGLHYQLNPYAQAKCLGVIVGTIWDVVVDLRKGSPTYGTWEGIWLHEADKKQLLIPRGYAHGFSVVSEYATILYKTDQNYQPEFEAGIYYLDDHLAIDWQINVSDAIISKKDQYLPLFNHSVANFEYIW